MDHLSDEWRLHYYYFFFTFHAASILIWLQLKNDLQLFPDIYIFFLISAFAADRLQSIWDRGAICHHPSMLRNAFNILASVQDVKADENV